MTVVNMVGVRKVGQAQIVMVGVSVVGLIVLVVMGTKTYEPQLMQPSCSTAGTGS